MTLQEEKIYVEGRIAGLEQTIKMIQSHKEDPDRVIASINKALDRLRLQWANINLTRRYINSNL